MKDKVFEFIKAETAKRKKKGSMDKYIPILSIRKIGISIPELMECIGQLKADGKTSGSIDHKGQSCVLLR